MTAVLFGSLLRMGVALLIAGLALGLIVSLVQLRDARADLAEEKRLGAKVRPRLHRLAAQARPAHPPAPAPAPAWTHEPDRAEPIWHLQWDQPPPVAPVPWPDPDPADLYEAWPPLDGDTHEVPAVPDDVHEVPADVLEQIADLWDRAEIPSPGEGEEGPPEHEGPDAVQEAAGEGATTPAGPAPIPWATELGWPPPIDPGAAGIPTNEGPPDVEAGPAMGEGPTDVAAGPNPVAMWVGLARAVVGRP